MVFHFGTRRRRPECVSVVQSARDQDRRTLARNLPRHRLSIGGTVHLAADCRLGTRSTDVAFLGPALDETDGLIPRKLPDEPLWFAMPTGHTLATRQTLDLVELASEPFILYPRENGRAIYDPIIASCRNAGFRVGSRRKRRN